MSVFRYLKRAFVNRWNLLALLGGLGFAFLSGQPDVFVPLVIAAEVAYLGLLGANPKFQQYVNAQEHKAATNRSAKPELLMRQILAALPEDSVRKFHSLRNRCIELRRLAQQMRDPQHLDSPGTLEELQLAGLDRLLWIYLRLLFTQYSLECFLEKTSRQAIAQDIQRLESQLAKVPHGEDLQQQRLRRVLEDNLQTSKLRLANFDKAQGNHQLVQLEIDRLENKIHSLSELAINRHESNFISAQIEETVNSMVQTERTMSELHSITGLESIEQEVPEMISRETVPLKH